MSEAHHVPLPLLEAHDLMTHFHTPDGKVLAVNNVSFRLNESEVLGIVGESGSGKTQIFLSIMGLLAKNGQTSGHVSYQGREILNLPKEDMNQIRGNDLAMIFQDPMTSLNPFLKVETQLTEVLIHHRKTPKKEAKELATDMLNRVGIPDAKQRIGLYPHEFSGGMRQRIMIAMALLCEPKILIADEPTTALDVTMQAQILDLLLELRNNFNTAIVMITHDLGVIASVCDRVMVMYAGRIVEKGKVQDIFYNSQHPYTAGLLRSTPRIDQPTTERLETIPGQPPNLQNLPKGCAYQERCPFVTSRCREHQPELRDLDAHRAYACFWSRDP